MTEPKFTDEDWGQWKITLSGKARSVLMQRKEFEALLARMEAAEEIASYFSNHPDSAHWWPYAQNAMEAWRKASGK